MLVSNASDYSGIAVKFDEFSYDWLCYF